jgi:gamma-glutamylcysteine synthetase
MLHLSSAFNAISGLITAITANAPFKNGLHKGCLAERQQMWIDFSPTRTGQPPGWWRDWDNYAEWVLRKEYILGPNQEGGMMKHGKPFWAFCAEKFQERGCLDLEFFEKHLLPHVSCLWQDARQRAAYGTVEVRPACQQPPGMGIAHDALILGLASNKERFLEFACQLDWQAWQAVKRSALLQGRKGQVDGIDIWAMAFKLVRIAYDGLEIRGLEESQYLEPYFLDLGRSWKTHAERQLDLTKDWPEHEEKFREEFIY